MNVRFSFVVVLITAVGVTWASSAWAQTGAEPTVKAGDWPDTPAGRRAKAFIEALNAGDDETLRRFVTEDYSPESLREEPIENKISMFQGIRAPIGTLKVSSVRAEGENTVIILAKCQNISIWLELTIKLKKEAPHYWAGVKALPTAPP